MSKNIVDCIHWDPDIDQPFKRNTGKTIGILAGAAIAVVAVVVSLVLFTPPSQPKPPKPDGGGQTIWYGVTQPQQSAPGSSNPEYQRGDALVKEQRFEEAIAAFDLALMYDPQSSAAYMNRGYCNFMLDRYQNAVTDYTKTLRYSTDNRELLHAHTMRGGAYYWLQHYPEAIGDLTQAIKMDPISQNAANAYKYRAEAYEAMNEFALAQADYLAAQAITTN